MREVSELGLSKFRAFHVRKFDLNPTITIHWMRTEEIRPSISMGVTMRCFNPPAFILQELDNGFLDNGFGTLDAVLLWTEGLHLSNLLNHKSNGPNSSMFLLMFDVNAYKLVVVASILEGTNQNLS